jgi:tetratricopeptide (TPR) repeat protein
MCFVVFWGCFSCNFFFEVFAFRGRVLFCGSNIKALPLSKKPEKLGNWRSSLEDAAAALSLTDGANPKAAYRAARAAFKLGRLDEAGAHAEAGLRADPSSPELLRLREVGFRFFFV